MLQTILNLTIFLYQINTLPKDLQEMENLNGKHAHGQEERQGKEKIVFVPYEIHSFKNRKTPKKKKGKHKQKKPKPTLLKVFKAYRSEIV